MPTETVTDFLVIGSGIAGLTYALQTARHGRTVVLTKKSRAESNTNYAQGGIAGVMGDGDDLRLHAEDTVTAGAGLCDQSAVDLLVREGPDRIRDLIALGARFSTTTDVSGREVLELGREGGHSRNRIVHAVDRTGWECERALLAAVKDEPRLEVLEHFFVIDLAMTGPRDCPTVIGAYALNTATGEVCLFRSGAVLLASGGCGRVYLHTTNPDIATADGVAMAWRAGAVVSNMEFVQFHPTSLYHPHGRSFLISEAVRGEGGILRTGDGAAFMAQYHRLADLAPRDVVARAIHTERIQRGDPCVYLDVTHLGDDFLRRRFPTIHGRCLELGLDISKEPIPVVPAAHYMCGGVETDLNGCTSLQGLYAAGEVACTGVHGANRLASNSLLEAMVFAHRAALHSTGIDRSRAFAQSADAPARSVALIESGPDAPPPAVVPAARRHLQAVMHDYAGIVRTSAGLATAARLIARFGDEADDLVRASRPEPDLYELRNMAAVAHLIVRCSADRRESRGLHYNVDYPTAEQPSAGLPSRVKLQP